MSPFPGTFVSYSSAFPFAALVFTSCIGFPRNNLAFTLPELSALFDHPTGMPPASETRYREKRSPRKAMDIVGSASFQLDLHPVDA